MAVRRVSKPPPSERPYGRVLGLLLALGLVVLGLAVLAKSSREGIRNWDRYRVAFSAIDCPAPPGLSREEFLAEVQYLAGWPDQVTVLDEQLASRLAEAFAKHPAVASVASVKVRGPRDLQVALSFREPVLHAIWLSPVGKTEANPAEDWVVDGQGIVLPRYELQPGLPSIAVSHPPKGSAGEPWGDPNVETAARLAGLLHRHQRRLQIKSIEEQPTGFVLKTANDVRILWGRDIGGEAKIADLIHRLELRSVETQQENTIDLTSTSAAAS